jgi:hypothetical protein
MMATENRRVITKPSVTSYQRGNNYRMELLRFFGALLYFAKYNKTIRHSLTSILYFDYRSRVSSGSIVSDYGLDDRVIGVRSPAGAKDFSSILCVRTGSGAYSASCKMETGGSFPRGKARSGRDVDHSPSSSADVVNEYELFLLSPQVPLWRVAGLFYLYLDSQQFWSWKKQEKYTKINETLSVHGVIGLKCVYWKKTTYSWVRG